MGAKWIGKAIATIKEFGTLLQSLRRGRSLEEIITEYSGDDKLALFVPSKIEVVGSTRMVQNRLEAISSSPSLDECAPGLLESSDELYLPTGLTVFLFTKSSIRGVDQ